MSDAYVGDDETMQTRILAEPCSTCITLTAGERLALDNARVTEFIRSAVDADSYIVCHSTLPAIAPAGVKPAVCRGFADRFDTAALRTIRACWGFLEVPVPDVHGGHDERRNQLG